MKPSFAFQVSFLQECDAMWKLCSMLRPKESDLYKTEEFANLHFKEIMFQIHQYVADTPAFFRVIIILTLLTLPNFHRIVMKYA